MTPNPVMNDPVLDEIHRTRERIAEQFDGDTAAILEDALLRQAASGRVVWKRPVTQLVAMGATHKATNSAPK